MNKLNYSIAAIAGGLCLSLSLVGTDTAALADAAAVPDAAYTEGVRLRDKGDLDGALAKFNEASSRHKASAEIMYARGTTFEWKGDRSKAMADFEKAVSLDPRNDEYRLTVSCLRLEDAELLMAVAAKMRIANDDLGASAKYKAAIEAVGTPEDRAYLQRFYDYWLEALHTTSPGPAGNFPESPISQNEP